MEQSRMEALLQAFRGYVDLQRGISPEVLSSCERMSKNVDNINLQAVRLLPPLRPLHVLGKLS